MAEPKEVRDYYANRNRLILLHAKLHDALCKVTEDEYWSSSGACHIHHDIVHPEWEKIKDRIYPTLMIWQIAYMVNPFRDVWLTHNPFDRNSHFMERLQVMYEIIDCVECGYIKNYQLPPEIQNPSQLEIASLENKVKIKIHFDELADAIKKGGLNWWNSKWVRLWVAHSTRAKKPKLPFLPAPEAVHIQGVFNEQKFFYKEVDEGSFDLQEVQAPEWAGITQNYVDSFIIWQEKYRSRNIHPVFENMADLLEKNLNTESVIEIQPLYMAGDPRPPTYKLGEKPQPGSDTTTDPQAIQPTTTEPSTNTPDSLPTPWLTKKAEISTSTHTTTDPPTNTPDGLPAPKVEELEAEILKLEAKLQEMEAEWSEFLDPLFSEPEAKQKPEKPRYVPKPTGARPETLENLERWHSEIKRLYGTSRKFKYHAEICRHIASLSGETAKYEHIRKQTRDYFRQLKPKEKTK